MTSFLAMSPLFGTDFFVPYPPFLLSLHSYRVQPILRTYFAAGLLQVYHDHNNTNLSNSTTFGESGKQFPTETNFTNRSYQHCRNDENVPEDDCTFPRRPRVREDNCTYPPRPRVRKVYLEYTEFQRHHFWSAISCFLSSSYHCIRCSNFLPRPYLLARLPLIIAFVDECIGFFQALISLPACSQVYYDHNTTNQSNITTFGESWPDMLNDCSLVQDINQC